VTTVIVGNCGISAATATMRGDVPDPMNLLGEQAHFIYPTVEAYAHAVEAAAVAQRRDADWSHRAA
jgi:N-acyl-D-amino-acid deacylase